MIWCSCLCLALEVCGGGGCSSIGGGISSSRTDGSNSRKGFLGLVQVSLYPSKRNGRLSEIQYILPLLKCLNQLQERSKAGLMRTIPPLKSYWIRKSLSFSTPK